MAKQWYKNNYRRNLVDMHIDAWNEEFLSQFDPDRYFHCLKTGKIAGPMIYTHSHVGWCNWPSKSGAMHPCWKGENKIKRLFDLCNKAGMDVIAYYSLIYNNWAYEHHPGWRMIGLDGFASREETENKKKQQAMMGGLGRYGLVCPNNGEYRAFLRKQFAELVEHYEFKGIFLDMTFWPMICYCPSCRARYQKETGKSLPETIDWTDREWLFFQEAREQWMTDFGLYATAELRKLRPELTIEHQYSTATHPWTFGVRSSLAAASDYIGGDLYGGFEQQSFICKLYYGMTANQPFEYMTSRCDPALFDHTTTKSTEMMKLHAYLTYAHHGAFLAIDAIDPRGTMNEQFYELLGSVFDETKQYEPFFTGELTADVALYFSFASKMDLRNNSPRQALLAAGETYQHINCNLGAAKALRNAHIPYRVITDKRLNRLSQNKVIILTDLVFLSQVEEDALVEYLRLGGSLYISGITPANLTQRLLGLRINGLTQEQVTYMSPTEKGQPFFCSYDRNYPMTIFGKQMQPENAGNNTVLATITLPYTNPADSGIFASIHSNPPGIKTEMPAMVRGQFGKGNVIWSAAPFEESSQKVHKQVFTNLISYLNPAKPMIETDAPAQIEFTVFTDPGQDLIQLHCVNVQEQSPMIPLSGFSMALFVDRIIKSVKLLPNKQEVPFTQKDGYVEFRTEGIDIFLMFQMEFA
jgi:hypothetical protein